jgi:hypothetical protein
LFPSSNVLTDALKTKRAISSTTMQMMVSASLLMLRVDLAPLDLRTVPITHSISSFLAIEHLKVMVPNLKKGNPKNVNQLNPKDLLNLQNLLLRLSKEMALELFLSNKMPNACHEKLDLENTPPLKAVELHAGSKMTVKFSFMTAKMVNVSRN